MTNPSCPVTGQPSVRRVQWVESEFLIALWRVVFSVDVSASFAGVQRFGLWESPTGLYFFDPMIEGDHEFYARFYGLVFKRKLWARDAIRHEFEVAARRINPGERVLDVGCGSGSFRHVIPHATYVGLDPNPAVWNAAENVHNETLRDHLKENTESYNVVCAFQVLEHMSSPHAMFADMVRAVHPGGLVIVGVPHVPSALTRIPNFLINAPPHHLTWWTKYALQVLAERAGTTVDAIEHVDWGAADSLIYWIERCSPIRCTDIHFRHAWSWHAATLIGFCAGRVANVVRKVPKTSDEGVGLLLIARRNT